MSEKTRKSFTSQHKAKVALEAIRGIKTLNEVAQEFAVHPTQVGEWKKVLLAHAPGIFDTKRGPKSPDDPSANPERLYSEIGRLKMELDWLKKKSGIGL
jgi:transposase-like protein